MSRLSKFIRILCPASAAIILVGVASAKASGVNMTCPTCHTLAQGTPSVLLGHQNQSAVTELAHLFSEFVQTQQAHPSASAQHPAAAAYPGAVNYPQSPYWNEQMVTMNTPLPGTLDIPGNRPYWYHDAYEGNLRDMDPSFHGPTNWNPNAGLAFPGFPQPGVAVGSITVHNTFNNWLNPYLPSSVGPLGHRVSYNSSLPKANPHPNARAQASQAQAPQAKGQSTKDIISKLGLGPLRKTHGYDHGYEAGYPRRSGNPYLD